MPNAEKLVIFDLDGTLIDAYRAIVDSLNFTMDKLGLPARGLLEIKRAVGWGDRNLLKPFVPLKILSEALDIYRTHHKKALVKNSRLLPFARQLLSKLKKKQIKLAVASNRPTEFSLILLECLKIRRYFDYILCADRLKFRKPHPLILNKVVRRLKIEKKNVLYVGDMALDACTGKRAKIRTIIVLGGSSTRSQIKEQRPFRIVRTLRQALKVIEKEGFYPTRQVFPIHL